MLTPAFEKAGNAGVSALWDDVGGLAAIADTLHQYAQAVASQHAELSRLMKEVVDTSLADCAESLEMLEAMTEKMEAAYKRIDDLQAAMDLVNDKIIVINATLKQVEKSGDVKVRAASFFKSVVGGLKRDGASSAKDEMWTRIPTYAMVDNCSVKDFSERLRQMFVTFDSVKPMSAAAGVVSGVAVTTSPSIAAANASRQVPPFSLPA